ncbi:probable serine/threonine-protein kinase DDB_G0267514 [Hyalella azteca]|uniref:Probable serine/threonine-protein kinase DDB_G0267514 n=1 Tax=Hyalella azteca TaxID=294128 RepID=A0A8B7N1M6_HYAAZ|nr:probable serine/threonine-protein kinase DDB_G0267514 [Hyalella azteca]
MKIYHGTMSPQRERFANSETSTSKLLLSLYRHLLNTPQDDLDLSSGILPENEINYAVDRVVQKFNQAKEIERWKNDSKLDEDPRTSTSIITNFIGNNIKYEDIEFRSIIGKGAFGEVYIAKYLGSIIAVKKLHIQRVSKKMLRKFNEEVTVLSALNHPDIVKFIGACVVSPNLCICMEYLKMSLHEALHMQEVGFSESQKFSMICHVALGLEYLHSQDVAHCDIKSQNVMIDFDVISMDDSLTAKLTDFGLSMMKNNSESISSSSEFRGHIGTPRYSAPEVLRGEMLNIPAWMAADVYSLSLVVFEIVCGEEPFDTLSVYQLRKEVGEKCLTPQVSEDLHVETWLQQLLCSCWSRDPLQRPSAAGINASLAGKRNIYCQN